MTVKLNDEVIPALPKEQVVLGEEISTYFDGFNQSFEHQSQYAFITGLKLIALKACCENGNKPGALGYMKTRELLIPQMSRSAAGRFVEFCQLLQEKLPTVGNFRPEQLKLTNGDLPADQKEQVLKAVYEATSGKTWTQLYRDLGKTREKKHPVHHPRKAVSPEEQVESENRGAEELANMYLLHAHNLTLDDRVIALLKPMKKQELLAAGIKVNDMVRKYLGKKISK